MYSGVIVGRVQVRQQSVDGPESRELHFIQHRQIEHAVQVHRAQPAGVDLGANAGGGVRLVARQQRLGAAGGADPRTVGLGRQFDEAAEYGRVKKRKVARDDDHEAGVGVGDCGVQAAQRAGARNDITVHPDVEVGKTVRVIRHHADRVRNSPQDLELPYDDGTAVNDEAALVASVESAGESAGHDRCGDSRRGHELIMTEAQLGRLLPACLHQAIADVLPQRLEFYEEWLNPDGLRDGSIGLAPLSAVTGFLRTEEGGGYDAVVTRAGTLAAQWSSATLPPYQRRLAASLPAGLRCRFALRVASRIIRGVLSTSRAATKVRRGRATMRVNASVFCGVRDPQPAPLCGFYRALAVETLRIFHITTHAEIESCRAASGSSCTIVLDIVSEGRADRPAIAA